MPKPIDEATAKAQLSRILGSFTPGSMLHLLSDLFETAAEEARQVDDAALFERCKLVQHTLLVVGIGVDGAMPR